LKKLLHSDQSSNQDLKPKGLLFFSGGAGIRRLEIRKWLQENQGYVGRWIVLDDMDFSPHCGEDEDFLAHCVKTDPLRGLMKDTYADARAKFDQQRR